MYFILLIVGAAVGYFAARSRRVHLPIVTASVAGAAGAVVAGMIVRMMLSLISVAVGLIAAIAGAVLVIALLDRYARGRGR